MPIVTDIKQQQKRTDRYSVYVDGSYAFAIEALELSASGLRLGQEVTAEELEQYAAQAGASKATGQAQRFISYRLRSEREVATYLRGKGHDPQTIDSTMAKLRRYGLVDDRAFAEAWVGDKRLLNKASNQALKQDLFRKGVSREIIDEVTTGEGAERAALRDLAQKKLALGSYQDQSKLIRYLLSKGFRYDDIKAILGELSVAAGDE